MLWLGAAGTGACIALGTGQGVASADTESDSSRSSDNSRSSSATDTDSSTPAGGTGSAGSTRDTDTSTDAVTDTSRSAPNRVVTLQRQTAEDEGQAAEDDAAETTAEDEAPETDKRSATVNDTTGAEEAQEPSVAPAESAPVVTEPAADVVELPEAPTPSTSEGSAVKVRSDPVTAAEPVTTAEPVRSDLVTTADPDPAAAEVGALAASAGTVTGVQTGKAKLTIPVGTNGYTTRADWYLPTQADGSVSATGVMWLQHGFLGNKLFVSALAERLSQQTNSIVVAPNISSFPLFCSACWLNGVPMQQAVASMFLADRASLNASALAAGFQGTLPENFILSGQSAGGGFAAAAGGYYATDPGNDDSLRGVVMFDGFAWNGVVTDALQRLDTLDIPVYQVAAPPQPWNSNGAATAELVAARPGQFVGATLAGGSHYDSLIGANPLIDFFGQLVTGFSPPGNTEAVYTLATGWINDMYQGLGPTDGNGIYGAPDEYIVMGDTAAIVLGPPPVVDINSYLGTWYEVGSVKQFFSIGLVNTTAVYSPNPDGSIKVENSGNYFFNNGPQSTITGVALPVDSTNNKLNVRFFGPASADPPGNYWIVDLDPDYQWAVVSDRTGLSGFLLSRTRTVSDALYQELLDRASVKGVKGRITPTRQPAAEATTAL